MQSLCLSVEIPSTALALTLLCCFFIGIVWLYSEHSHHWQPSDHIALQRYHQTRHNQETAWRRPTFPKKSVSTRGFDSGVPGALPRQNTTPVQRDHQTAPTPVLEELQWMHWMVTFFKHTIFSKNTDADFEEGQICRKDQRLNWYLVTVLPNLLSLSLNIFEEFEEICVYAEAQPWLSTMIFFIIIIPQWFLFSSINMLKANTYKKDRRTDLLDGRWIFLVETMMDTRIIQQQLTIYSGFVSVILKQIQIPSLVIIDNLILNGVVDVRPLQCWRHWDFEDFWAPAEPFGIYLIYFHSLTHLNSLQVLSGSSWSIRCWHLWWCDYRIFEITEMLSALMLKNTLNRLICHLCTQKQWMAVTIITEIVCPKRIHWKEECSHLHGALNI